MTVRAVALVDSVTVRAVALVVLLAVSVLAIGIGVTGTAAADPLEPVDLDASDLEGDGTEDDPYEITNASELQAMEDDLDANYTLVDDVDASETRLWNDGAGFEPIGENGGEFTGTFDGNGHGIVGLHVDLSRTDVGDDAALFGRIEGGRITSVGLVGADIRAAGGSEGNGGHGDAAGGLVATSDTGVVTDSYVAESTITGGSGGGGVDRVELADSDGGDGGDGGVSGGIVAVNDEGVVTDSFVANSTISGGDGGTGGTGGGLTNECCRGGHGGDGGDSGGVVSVNTGGNVTGSYVSETDVSTGSGGSGGGAHNDENGEGGSSGSAGGIVADNAGTVEDSYWDTETTSADSSDGGTPLTTDEMSGSSAAKSMDGFDFVATWNVTSGYPDLAGLDVDLDVTDLESHEITTASELQAMEHDLDGNFELVDDVDATETSEWNDGDGFEPIGDSHSPFTGTLDGNGHEISGLYADLSQTAGADAGLFGRIEGATITSVGLRNGEIRAGDASDVDHAPDHEHGDTAGTGGSAAGLVGISQSSVVNNSYVDDATIAAGDGGDGGDGGHGGGDGDGGNGGDGGSSGGIVARNDGGIVDDSYVTDSTIISGDGGNGGESGNAVNHEGGDAGDGGAGGGLVGVNAGGTITRSYSAETDVSTSAGGSGGFGHTGDGQDGDPGSVGGFVADNAGTIEDSYWDAETTTADSSDGGTPLATDEMQGEDAIETMAGLSFDTTWWIVTGPDEYPALRAHDPAGFDVTIDDANESVIVGETITVDATVRNTGSGSDAQDVVLSADGGEKDRAADLEISGDTSEEVALEWETEPDEGGTYDVTVATEDVVDTVSVNVEDRYDLEASDGAESTGLSDPVTVDDGLTIDTTVANIDAARVTLRNVQDGDELSADTDDTDVVAEYDPDAGVLVLSGEDSVADYESVLRTVEFNNTADDADTDATDREIAISLGDAVPSEETGHYYEFVEDEDVSWDDARTDAAAEEYFGLSGYLVTVTSRDENDFLQHELDGRGWIGATDEAEEGEWRWVTGPEGAADGGDGLHFWTRTDEDTDTGPNGEAEDGEYANWDDGEPNDAGGEDYPRFRDDPPGTWNDQAGDSPVDGYVVEYGDVDGDADVRLRDAKTVTLSDETDPQADAGGDRTVEAGDAVAFDGSGSTDNVDVTAYEWDFDDGDAESADEEPSHTFGDSGTYEVELTVTDSAGNTDTDTATVTIIENTPIDDCGVVDEPGEYELAGDLESDGTCVEITASDVRFDGEGHTIDGANGSNTEGVFVHDSSGTLTNVTVTNLTVTNWNRGIVFDDVEESEISDVTANTNAGDGIHTTGFSDDIALRNVTANDNDGTGIFVEATGNSVIRNATANENRDAGIEIRSRWSNTVTGASLTANGDGIAVTSSPDSSLEDVSVRDTTAGDGLNSFGRAILIDLSDDVEITNSSVSNASDETFITRQSDATVANNFTVDGETFSFVAEDAELEAADSPSSIPPNYVDAGVFLDFGEAPIGLGSPDPVLDLTVPYTDADVAAVPDESSLALWRHDGTDWIEVTDSSVDADANAVSGNLTETGILAPLGTDITPPVTDAGPNQTVNEGASVSFDASGSSDNVGIVSYDWEFGDGTSATGETAAHAFDEPGTYAVALTVADDAGNTDTATVTVTVVDGTSPTADAGGNRTVDEGTTVTFDGSGSTDDVGVTTYAWDFDGTSATGESATHTFDDPGIYEITLTVADDAGNTDTATVEITVSAVDPIAEAIDANDDDRIDDAEILQAIELWRTDGPVTGTGGATIGDLKVLQLIEMWRTGAEV